MTKAQSVESALTALSFRYADAVRSNDVESWAATWAQDAQWHLTADRSVSGREAIVDLWVRSMAKYQRVVQHYLATSYQVDDDAGTASGRTQLFEFTLDADGASGVMSGHYDDTFVRLAAGWKFQSRQLTIYYRGAPDLSGSFSS